MSQPHSHPQTDEHREAIIKKFGLEDIVPRSSDFALARAQLMPSDGSTAIFAGGKPIQRRRESSSPAVEEALARGFKLAHFPSPSLLPKDTLSGGIKTSKITPSPEPVAPGGMASRGSSLEHASASRHSSKVRDPSLTVINATERIPGNISPHVLPQGLLLKPLPPARELLETHIPLQTTRKFERSEDEWVAGFDAGDWALSDPAAMIGLERTYRRCFPRTDKDEQLEEYPTSHYSGNYTLRRYGGNFPPHCRYNFYRKYSEFGINASTSEFHNFPAGRHPLAPV